MVRRIASQVHNQAGRLAKANHLPEIPLWLGAVMAHPPLPLPSKTPGRRTAFDMPHPSSSGPQTKLRARQVQPEKITYIEDDLRRQFFRDHPFEAFRAKSIVEAGEIEPPHPIQGKAWTRLRQHGRNPSPEDCVLYAASLHQHHEVPLSKAYAQAVSQFHSLRSERNVASTFAATEAEHYGSIFGRTEVERGHLKETAKLDSFQRQTEMDEGEMLARKRWRVIAERSPGIEGWSKGQQYVRLWKSGVRPNYAAALTTPADDTVLTEQIGAVRQRMSSQLQEGADFVSVLAKKAKA